MKGRDDARYLNLRLEVVSPEGSDLIADIAATTWGKTRKPSKSHHQACSALTGDLLKAADGDGKRYSYRPMGKGGFTRQWIRYRAFKQAVDGSLGAGLIEVRLGTGGGDLIGEATRFRATPRLLALAESFGITPSNITLHFRSIPRPVKIKDPLVLKTASRLAGWRKVLACPRKSGPY